jgi:predicted nucleotidyltransferase
MSLADALFGKTKKAVIGILFSNPGVSVHLRELARRANVSAPSILREVNLLEKAGILLSRQDGNRVQYEANSACPLFDELRGIAKKTFGIADQLREALADLRISVAFIFGSVARDEEKSHSDVDVLAIGSGSYRDILNQVRRVEEQIGRPVNVKFYKPKEFREMFAEGNAFLQRIAAEPKIYLIGDENGFKACQPD